MIVVVPLVISICGVCAIYRGVRDDIEHIILKISISWQLYLWDFSNKDLLNFCVLLVARVIFLHHDYWKSAWQLQTLNSTPKQLCLYCGCSSWAPLIFGFFSWWWLCSIKTISGMEFSWGKITNVGLFSVWDMKDPSYLYLCVYNTHMFPMLPYCLLEIY